MAFAIKRVILVWRSGRLGILIKLSLCYNIVCLIVLVWLLPSTAPLPAAYAHLLILLNQMLLTSLRTLRVDQVGSRLGQWAQPPYLDLPPFLDTRTVFP